MSNQMNRPDPVINQYTVRLHRKAPRSGMALLFVVSLILFITLLGTSFVVVSQQFSRSAQIATLVRARGDSSRQLVQRAFYDLVRGPDPQLLESPLRGGHAILPDMYGYGFAATVSNDVAAVGDGIPGAIEFTLSPGLRNLRPVTPGEPPLAPPVLSQAADMYAGHVVTFVSGPLSGTSVRIIGYSGSTNGVATGQPFSFIAYPEQSRDIPSTFTDANGNITADIRGAQVVMNGRAYSGWGAGGVTAAGRLAAAAVSPNRSVALRLSAFTSSGVNEDYDAPDYQNMFLSAIDNNSENGRQIIAAMDRQQLFELFGSDPDGPQNFRAFGVPGEPLQVDNDKDGQPDSIWIDPGYPVQTDVDGRRYKNLVAYLVLDMDGRFNVNAHGTLFDTDLDNDGIINRAVSNSGVNLLGNVNPTASFGNAAPLGLPRGQYLGPPEVSMLPLFGGGSDVNGNGTDDYLELMTSRYGADQLPGAGAVRDAWSEFSLFGHPDLFHGDEVYPNQWVGGLFGTALDIHARYGTGIPNQFVPGTNVPAGLSTADAETGLVTADEIRDSAYEFTLLDGSNFALNPNGFSDDQPFTAKEMERVLRRFDRDSGMLPDRLANIYGNRNRDLIGHASFETPAIPGLNPDPSLNDPDSGLRLEPAGVPVTLTQRVYNLVLSRGATPAQANLIVRDLLSVELRMGLPFDLNRAFGDGRDNDNDGIYDEPDEIALGSETLRLVNDTQNPMVSDRFARHNFARQLYVLALLVTGDTGVITDSISSLTPAVQRRLALAQWCINVADFRDSDSISSPFEFDLNPFDATGWDPTAEGDLSTPGAAGVGTLWGLERPELLLSETLAFHDRRTENLAMPDGEQTGDPDDDVDFDSRLVPNASVFFELYRPWTQPNSGSLTPSDLSPRELGATNSNDGINLTMESSPGSPVWRMVVSTGANFSRTNRDVRSGPGIDPIIETEQFRRIYFVEPNLTVEPITNRNKVYWPNATVQGMLAGNTMLQPGQYAVVGSAGTENGNAFDTWFGRRTETDFFNRLDQTRGITLLPGSRQIEIRSGSPNTTTSVIDALNIPINATVSRATGNEVVRSLGISDPEDGYFNLDIPPGDPGSDVTREVDGFAFNTIEDDPVDQTMQNDPEIMAALGVDGVTVQFRTVYLQRLADPTQPWDPVLNPYLTVDRQSVSLTHFNGVDGSQDTSFAMPGEVQMFASNERGRSNNPDLTTGVSSIENRRQLWLAEPAVLEGTAIDQTPFLGDTHHFSQALIGSLGQVNLAYNHTDFNGNVAPVGFAGLSFNNRPYANHMELLNVPVTSPFELLSPGPSLPNFSNGLLGYTLDQSGNSGSPYQAPVRGGQFGHLFNFFGAGTNAPNDAEPDNLANLLDFVRVPSRFAGTQIHLSNSSTLGFPFNVLSRFRIPGKLNINTMLDQTILRGWLGAVGQPFSVQGQNMDGSTASFINEGVNIQPGSVATPNVLEDSRRSVTTGRFDNPFRGGINFDKSPLFPLVVNYPVQPVVDSPAKASLLRNGQNDQIVFNTIGTLPWADPNRDSNRRFETLRRIGGTTTTRSSVFGIWITVGRFEVDEDGELLTDAAGNGVEIGAANGRAIRSRGFYMIDRSIPVAFEPGVNHNVENMILVESIID